MLEEFYRDNYPIVYGYLLSLCADPVTAEDLAAETFCKAIEQINKYDPKYKASTWLCTIAKNLYINELKKKKRTVSLENAAFISTPSAEVLHLQSDEAQRILTILDDFSSEHKQLFIMRLEGMSFRDIGLALGKSENWARVTYFRIKTKIKSEMEGDK